MNYIIFDILPTHIICLISLINNSLILLRKKFPEDDLHELFPEGSGDLASDQFEPGWFLLEHHHATSFDDLRVGLAFLRRKVEGQKEGQLSFLKVCFSNNNLTLPNLS